MTIQIPPAELEAAHRPGRLLWPVAKLEAKALEIRRDIITILCKSQTGHSGGPLSCADFGTALFFHELNIDPAYPKWPERDFWTFSIGHVTPVIYALMAERGYFPHRDLMAFRTFEGHCQGHPSAHDTPGIELSSGSLGQGLTVACGVAKAAQIDRHPRRVYCVMGDGEQQEGQIWERTVSFLLAMGGPTWSSLAVLTVGGNRPLSHRRRLEVRWFFPWRPNVRED